MEEKKATKKSKVLREVKIISVLALIILSFRSSFFEPFRIPSGSMIPTLMIGDFILVNKMSYGLKIPFSDFSFFDINFDPVYLFKTEGPDRGDVIVFKFPQDPSTNFIKRVVGVPGDILEIRDKVVYINSKPIHAKEINGRKIMEDMDDMFKVYNLRFYEVETGKHKHVIQQDHDNYYGNFHDKIEIPKGKYFVMGDNRDFSHDSRFWGLVPEKYIKGKALFVWFSMILPFGEHKNFKIRPGRMGTAIE